MITVGIPAHNEEKSIAKAITSMLKQISKKDELIVVSDGSTDNSVLEVKKVARKDKRVRLIIVPERKGKVNGLNLIIKNAKGGIIVQTDGDVIPSANSVKHLLNHFSDKKIGAVSGRPVPVISENNLFYDWAQMSYRKEHELRTVQSVKGILWHISGYLLAFRKEALQKVPDAKGAVDAWMGRLIAQKGYKIAYEPKAKVFVKYPATIKDFINQKARVRAGYYFLAKQSGQAPRTIQSEILFFPLELLKIPVWRWHKFIIAGFLYLYAWLRGIYLGKTNKSLQHIWKIPHSTK